MIPWIRGWPNLRVVASSKYNGVIGELVEKNLRRRRWWKGWFQGA